jgi:hypothetical protein
MEVVREISVGAAVVRQIRKSQFSSAGVAAKRGNLQRLLRRVFSRPTSDSHGRLATDFKLEKLVTHAGGADCLANPCL